MAANVAGSGKPQTATTGQVLPAVNTTNVSKVHVPIVKNVNTSNTNFYSSAISSSNNVNNAITSCIDQSTLLNLIMSNPENFYIILS